jgi:hypothetical protein
MKLFKPSAAITLTTAPTTCGEILLSNLAIPKKL